MLDLNFSLVRLFVLGLLSTRARHGYEIVEVAETWAVHRWGGISIGAIYHALGKLAKEGYVQSLKVEKAGNRPERQIWEITDSGRKLTLTYVEYGLSSLDFEGREIDMSLAFAGLLTPEVRVAKLKQRLGPLQERLDQLRHFHRSYEFCDETDADELGEYRRLKRDHPWIPASVHHGLGRLEFEREWTLELIDKIGFWPSIPDSTAVER